MRVEEILSQLREELNLIEKAIADIENLGRGGNLRPCRPSGFVTRGHRSGTMKSSSRQLRRLDR